MRIFRALDRRSSVSGSKVMAKKTKLLAKPGGIPGILPY